MYNHKSIISLLILILLITSIILGPYVPEIYAVPLIFLVIVLLLINIEYSLYIITFDVFLLRFASDTLNIIPRFLPTFLIDAIIIFLGFRALLRFRFVKRNPLNLTYAIVLLIFLSLIMTIYLGNSMLHWIIVGRIYFRFPLLLIIIFLNQFSQDTLKENLRLIWKIALIQPIVCVVEYYLYVVARFISVPAVVIGDYLVHRTLNDFVVGTLGYGQTGIMAIYMTFCILYVLKRAIHCGLRIKHLLLVIWFIIPPILGDAKAFIYILIFAIALLFIVYNNVIFKNNAIRIVIIFVITTLSLFLLIHSNSTIANSILSLEKANDKIIMGRVASLVYSVNLLKSINSLLFGTGIGTTYSGGFGVPPGRYVFSDNRISVSFQQSTIMLIEWGIIGVLFWLFYLFANLISLNRAAVKNGCLFESRMFLIITFLMIVCSFYTKTISSDIIMLIYVLIFLYYAYTPKFFALQNTINSQ